ncbi:Metallo-dependent phosphatase [Gigaspora margarita]|uniref:Metallo-dependent phosphatase n=1 Tax=Gigaspora margarita TaxID=4874 RepID=A0A8H4ABY1_GIGMA|nr:Metallo-dependent phosphatase [Gigaspora margarita]
MQLPPKQTPTESSTNSSFCASTLARICRFPFHLITKITQKLLGPVKRISRRSQNRSPTCAFKIIWISALLVGEIFIFYYAMRKCSWPYNPHWDTSLADPFRIALIADPQIIDSYSYGRTGILQRVSEIYPDMYMRKNWINLQNIFDPDAIIFLGDLMDGGREWDDDKWEDELFRYRHLFLPKKPTRTPIYYLVGNHDIGFGDNVILRAYERFRKVFGKTNYNVVLGNHSIVVVDTVTLSGSNESLKEEGINLIKRLENDSSNNLPRILMTHIPLYRPPNTDCGPLRQNGHYINQGAGYQYQNLVTESLSNFILNSINPILIFSGDDHDYCEIRHERESKVIEISVNSFSFAMGVKRPGFLLLSLYNPTNSSTSLDDIKNNQSTFAYTQCLLPNQIRIYLWYGVLVITTLSCIFSHTFVKIRRSTEMLPVWLRYQQKKRWILFNSQFWKTAGKDIVSIASVALVTYLICWIWFLVG